MGFCKIGFLFEYEDASPAMETRWRGALRTWEGPADAPAPAGLDLIGRLRLPIDIASSDRRASVG
jgi:hypothetical protein